MKLGREKADVDPGTDRDIDLAGRLTSLEQFTGTLVIRPTGEEPRAVDVIPIRESPVSLVPVPRRSRVFLRGGEGHGAFADLTLTAPRAAIE